jgi:hypothetical protein
VSRSKRILVATSVAAGLIELALATIIEVPAAALTFGALFLLAALWIHRRRAIAPVVVVGLAFLLELVGLPVYDRTSVSDRVIQIAFGALSLVGLLAAGGMVIEHRRARVVAKASNAMVGSSEAAHRQRGLMRSS